MDNQVFPTPEDEAGWELLWAPYDESTYREVLKEIEPGESVLEIGAGDLRLARRLARVCRQVVAVEIQTGLVERAIAQGEINPKNLHVICGDALTVPLPPGLTAAVLLMRHCRRFRLYADRLKAVGCRRLITNARWRMGVETIDLQAARLLYAELELGWYACWCGTAGFKSGPEEKLTEAVSMTVQEVIACPKCHFQIGLKVI